MENNSRQNTFSPEDIQQITSHQLTLEKVESQIRRIQQGSVYTQLDRPCLAGDGIKVIAQKEVRFFIEQYDKAAADGRVMKFVPASGAASRMFDSLVKAYQAAEAVSPETNNQKSGQNDDIFADAELLMKNLKHFAFYEDLAAVRSQGHDLDVLIAQNRKTDILKILLTADGLDYMQLPKGLIKFHRYKDHVRTPFEEHLVEAAEYCRDREGKVNIHFTITDDYQEQIAASLRSTVAHYAKKNVRFVITYSSQKKSTDIIALDLKNNPYRDDSGRLVFRPGGHGALLENLQDRHGDIVFIKNIDNITTDAHKGPTFTYKRVIGGYLVSLQSRIFDFLGKIEKGTFGSEEMSAALDFMKNELSISLADALKSFSEDQKKEYIRKRLNRPLRVCGMVKNEGEPGGGPAWVQINNEVSLQIVESSQINKNDPQQKDIAGRATHFNPVDIVCGMRDYKNDNFNLPDFVDHSQGLVSVKPRGGDKVKVLELPGLWNGGMAHWLTVFVEVPIETFSPVKTFKDLLRKQHIEGN